ncbi:superoxide dismutase family protein [Aureisphaera sp. CAU 1614]|uniref:Superoxide dismutase [Cu-Zn] n=1 Tax=Halomarinibacterium sedimenti TaxID=2857106 RepID=A0A9X1FQV3_9FLAO|nr:superoxide dismutase family protein [Halomarinibacterium sedimenti]MBW2938172.1 superoxide dismutase family protein [Halomarinibacterium sedimenti]
MKTIVITLFSLIAIIFLSCKNEAKKDQETTDEIVKEVVEEKVEMKELGIVLEPRSGSTAEGKVLITEENGEVTLAASFYGLTPGTHAIHIHEKADCSAADGTSSGGHWNPTFTSHGKWGATEGYHKGDIGNFEADENGQGTITLTTNEWCLGCGDENKDIIGKAIIVHQGADDFTTQPTGNAGGRVSCGGIIK